MISDRKAVCAMKNEETLMLEIDADVYDKVAAIAAREGTDIGQIIRDMVRDSVSALETPDSSNHTESSESAPVTRRFRARDAGDSE